MKRNLFLIGLLVLPPSLVWAQDRPSEDSMFGGGAAVGTAVSDS